MWGCNKDEITSIMFEKQVAKWLINIDDEDHRKKICKNLDLNDTWTRDDYCMEILRRNSNPEKDMMKALLHHDCQ